MGLQSFLSWKGGKLLYVTHTSHQFLLYRSRFPALPSAQADGLDDKRATRGGGSPSKLALVLLGMEVLNR